MSAYLETINRNTFTKPVYVGNLDACKEQGEAAGDQAYPQNGNPYEKGTAEHQWWDAGWLNSRDELCGDPS